MIDKKKFQRGIVLLSAFLVSSYCSASGFPSSSDETPPSPGDKAKAKEAPLPLRTTRTISFDTDQGTWMSLDVSPDGTTIVFELLGDIYTLPIAGGQAKAVLDRKSVV